MEQTEALTDEANTLSTAYPAAKRPLNDGIAGLRIVSMLEAADESLKKRGKPVQL